tara:strand:+ start:1966 stop:2190 length:225 start_codon:yes stop_codon:yes gene_type:complete
MPSAVNDVLGFILAIGLLLWLGAAPVIAIRSLFTRDTPKPKKKTKAKAPSTTKEKPENVIDTYGKKYTLTEVEW